MPSYKVRKAYTDLSGKHIAGETISLDAKDAGKLCQAGYLTPQDNMDPLPNTIDTLVPFLTKEGEAIDARDVIQDGKIERAEVHLSTTFVPQ